MKKFFLPLIVTVFMAITVFLNAGCSSTKEIQKLNANRENYNISGLKNGELMLWDICSQCQNTFSVTIKDNERIYTNADKNDYENALQILSHDTAFYKGDGDLQIEIEFDNSSVILKTAKTSSTIKKR